MRKKIIRGKPALKAYQVGYKYAVFLPFLSHLKRQILNKINI